MVDISMAPFMLDVHESLLSGTSVQIIIYHNFTSIAMLAMGLEKIYILYIYIYINTHYVQYKYVTQVKILRQCDVITAIFIFLFSECFIQIFVSYQHLCTYVKYRKVVTRRC